MRIKTLIFALLLSACANDHYSVIPGSDGSNDKIHSDLYDCHKQAYKAYNAQKSTGAQILQYGGGAIGGLLSAGLSESNDSAIKLSDIKVITEKCMNSKGYQLVR